MERSTTEGSLAAGDTLGMPTDKGGLNAPDLQLIYSSSRLAWIGRILRLQNATFVKALQNRIQANMCDIVHINIDMMWTKSRRIPYFYEEMFALYRALPISRSPACGREVRRQMIWHNLLFRSVPNRSRMDRFNVGTLD